MVDLAQAAIEAKQDLAARGIPTSKAVSMFDNVRIVSNEQTSRFRLRRSRRRVLWNHDTLGHGRRGHWFI
jgi:hypothetical protein